MNDYLYSLLSPLSLLPFAFSMFYFPPPFFPFVPLILFPSLNPNLSLYLYLSPFISIFLLLSPFFLFFFSSSAFIISLIFKFGQIDSSFLCCMSFIIFCYSGNFNLCNFIVFLVQHSFIKFRFSRYNQLLGICLTT